MAYVSRSFIQAACFSVTLASVAAWAGKPPADPCSLLPPADISKVLGRPFGPPESSVAPRPFKNTAQGTDCVYQSQRGKGSVMFRVYFDSSPAEATDLFARLKMWFGQPTPVPGVADDTYIDSKHGLHARKGNVRFYIEFAGMNTAAATKDKQLSDLATAISGRI